MGWHQDQIVTLDEDLGQSGAEATHRTDFQRLVADVGLGQVGVVLSLEISRLARNSADWHRLLELCAMTDTLILDEDGLYDPNQFNDRLLLGLRGTMSEAELHFLRARMDGGKLNKARRGELQTMLPAGLIYDPEGHVQLDPDRQVQQAIRKVFELFQRFRSAWQVVCQLQQAEIRLPVRLRAGPQAGETIWTEASLSRVLKHPEESSLCGHVLLRPDTPAEGRSRSDLARLPMEGSDSQRPSRLYPLGAVRGESADPCGERPPHEEQGGTPAATRRTCFAARHRPVRALWPPDDRLLQPASHRQGEPGPIAARYESKEHGGKFCQHIPGRGIDQAVSQLAVQALTPEAVDAAVAVFEELQRRNAELAALYQSQVERARHEAESAQRQFFLANPENRLVADNLEKRWNDKLRALAEAENAFAGWKEKNRFDVSPPAREDLLRFVRDFPALWNHPQTTARDRKQMLRLMIQDVTLLRQDDIHVCIRWKGGATSELHLPRPLSCWEFAGRPKPCWTGSPTWPSSTPTSRSRRSSIVRGSAPARG